ncbi:MAG: hypothetical protein JXA77_08405 [Bacteroidales bacterium]|nr:hypothetical protein [Bacteroidales bacterium]MBN2820951.1 hypothetical protein [Bacteroidales bacterium]
MIIYSWTQNELMLLEEWDWITRYLNAQKDSTSKTGYLIRKSFLEAKLIISNMLVITYNLLSSEPRGIHSFKEFLTEREKAIEEYSIPVQYHPVNFNNLWDYKIYLAHAREKLLMQ